MERGTQVLPPSLVSNIVCLVPNKKPWLGSSGTKAMSRRTTPGSTGRYTLSHSDSGGGSSDLAGDSCSWREATERGTMAAAEAVSEMNWRRVLSEEEEEALGMRRKRWWWFGRRWEERRREDLRRRGFESVSWRVLAIIFFECWRLID